MSLGRHALSCTVRREDPDELFQELSTLGVGKATDPAVSQGKATDPSLPFRLLTRKMKGLSRMLSKALSAG